CVPDAATPEAAFEPKSMEDLGLNPNSLADCEAYEAYCIGLENAAIDYEIAVEDAAIREADIEASYLESMAEEQAMIEGAVERGEVSEATGKAEVMGIAQRVVRFRRERGYDLPPLSRLVDLPDVLRGRAVRAQRGTTRAPRPRRVRSSAASRDGPSSD